MPTYMLVGEPDVINDDLFVRAETLDNLAALPVPENHIATARTAGDVLAVGGEANVAGVSGGRVARKALLFRLLERSVGRVDENLVVERLARKVLVYRVGSAGGGLRLRHTCDGGEGPRGTHWKGAW